MPTCRSPGSRSSSASNSCGRISLPGVTSPRVSNYVPQELSEEDLLTLTISGPYTAGALQKIADEQVEPRLSAVPGVGNIGVQGGTEPGVSVTYDPALLRQLGISPQTLGDALTGARVVQSLGNDQRGTTERPVVIRDQPQAVEDLANLPIVGRGGQPFALGTLASVRPEEDSRGFFFRINGQPAIAIGVSRLAGADAIKTAGAVRQAIREIEARLPTAVRLQVVYDDSVELARQLKDLLVRGSIAFALVLVVLLALLRDWRGTGLVMLSASVSVAGTALVLYILDIPANLLTLAGLAMGVGILVQDGLIVMDRLGTVPDTPEDRARAARAIAPAVTGATLTTAVVLFPFLYLQGNARAAFVPFASAFTIALGWSLFASVVMIPALARGHRVHETIVPALAAGVRPHGDRCPALALGGADAHRRHVRRAHLGLHRQGAARLVRRLRRAAHHALRRSSTFPRGSDPASLDAAMRELESQVVGRPGVEQVTAQTYGGFGAGMRVLFRRDAEYSAIPQELEEALTQRAVFIGGASITVRGQRARLQLGDGIRLVGDVPHQGVRVLVRRRGAAGARPQGAARTHPARARRGHQLVVVLLERARLRGHDPTRPRRARALRRDRGGLLGGRRARGARPGGAAAPRDRWRGDPGDGQGARRARPVARRAAPGDRPVAERGAGDDRCAVVGG